MKLLVFAHTPPPHHGQSYMVQVMLDGFGGDFRKRRFESRNDSNAEPYGIQCYHVNTRLSQKLEDIGDFRIGKFFLLLGYCLQALWYRVRYGVTNFYYIPAPGKRSALYRDWLTMFICRRFFKRIILHWHAAGLAKWLETAVQIRSRALTYRMLHQVDLSIVLSRYNRADAEKIFSKQIKIVSNGIPDPCPDFAENILPRRRARFAARQLLLAGKTLPSHESQNFIGDSNILNIVYLAHCTREKGLFDAVAGAFLAHQRFREQHLPITIRLTVAGNFVTEEEKAEFDATCEQEGLQNIVEYVGFVSGENKNKLLREADLFCFPTYYENENQPVNLIEALAFGLPILTTRWRSIPELFPANYPGLVGVRSPEQVARAISLLMKSESGEGFRQSFLENFTLERHLSSLAAALKQIEEPSTLQTAPVLGLKLQT
jgi:glycosyltransferase involved in cell wall biosynthesis